MRLTNGISFILLTVVLLCLLNGLATLSNPTSPREGGSASEVEIGGRPNEQPPPDSARDKDLLCKNTKGKICEMLCKNNPSEGGVLCK